jgi:hypothetical protein
MGASIHINGTGSSVVDTVFVCRSTGTVSRRSLAETADDFAELVADDLNMLRQGGLKPTRGDTRCIIFGHLTRMTIWNLKTAWNPVLSAQQKLSVVAHYMAVLPQPEEIEVAHLSAEEMLAVRYAVNEDLAHYNAGIDEIAF